jgi:hypothetical protein
MTAVRSPVALPDAFELVTENPPLEHHPAHRQVPGCRTRGCWHCRFVQASVYRSSLLRAYHWCERPTGRHFVIWETQ